MSDDGGTLDPGLGGGQVSRAPLAEGSLKAFDTSVEGV
jgi:hypothetical protein